MYSSQKGHKIFKYNKLKGYIEEKLLWESNQLTVLEALEFCYRDSFIFIKKLVKFFFISLHILVRQHYLFICQWKLCSLTALKEKMELF